MATVKCTKCHNPMQTNKAPGELEDCPKCKAVFEISYPHKTAYYHHSMPSLSQPSGGSSGLTIAGILILVVGFLIMGYFGLFYDTTVYSGGGDYVHNVGLMNNRTMGMIFGGFITIIGIGLIIADQIKK